MILYLMINGNLDQTEWQTNKPNTVSKLRIVLDVAACMTANNEESNSPTASQMSCLHSATPPRIKTRPRLQFIHICTWWKQSEYNFRSFRLDLVMKIGTSRGMWLTCCLMRTQESNNPSVTKGAGNEQWQAKHMSSARDTAKLLPPHTCYRNSLGKWLLFRQVILQQDTVSRDWYPAGNEESQDKTQKQSCTSKKHKIPWT